MKTSLRICADYTAFSNNIILIDQLNQLSKIGLNKSTHTAAKAFFEAKAGNVFQQIFDGKSLYIVKLEPNKEAHKNLEGSRKLGNQLSKTLNAAKQKEASFLNATGKPELSSAFAEGLILSSYEFNKYKTKDTSGKTLQTLHVDTSSAEKKSLDEIAALAEANFFTRDLINEPPAEMTAVHLSKAFVQAGKTYGFSVKVLDKKKIEALKMGGLLAVNRGSVDPPTFSILEYKPAKAKNKKPIVLVGKGVVYDTGGLSLKPTPNSMDLMKSDMSGAAAVGGIFIAAAKLKLPIHIIGLVPATDNRPSGNAYAPGDVVKMMSGLNVEVLNTDAEGRMILADALHFAKQYKPELVFDFATLTGAAVRAIGSLATAYMGSADENIKKKIETSGNATYERLIHFPLWEEYGDWIKSEIADINNVGPGEAGHITAGKFLEHFTDYPWLHFDIAGTAFVTKEDSYRGKYATGVGVRLITHFLKNY